MPIEEARTALRIERRKVCAEREALETFKRKIAELESEAVNANSTSPRLLTERSSRSMLVQVREAYEETMMDADHYDTDYGEDFMENVRVELGPECADLLRSGSELTPYAKRAIITAASESRLRRVNLISLLEDEAAMLRRAEGLITEARPLGDLDPDFTFDRLVTVYDTLDEDERRAEALLTERQEQLHRPMFENPQSTGMANRHLNDYLYDSLETTYPILHAVTRFIKDVRTTRATVQRRLACGYQ